MTVDEVLKKVGSLIKKARLEKGHRQQPFAKLAEVDTKTLASMEKGDKVSWETNQRKVERALDWRAGSIQEVIAGSADIHAGELTLDYMRGTDAEGPKGSGGRAEHLTDEELMFELSYRFRSYGLRLSGDS